VNARDSNGWTALWHATVDGNERLVKELVTAGADVSATDSDGKTLMEEAIDDENDEIIALLKG